jgi:hypothetical protein
MQVEYATDIVFKTQPTLQAIYPHLLETLIQVVKLTDIATFLGRKMHGNSPVCYGGLREHGLIKRVRKCYRYYLTDLGRQVAMTALKLREMIIIPSLAFDVA